MLAKKANMHKDRIAFSWLEKGEVRASINYSELHQKCDIIAARLQNQFSQGDRIALVFGPGLDFVEAFFACTRAGLIPVPLSPSLGRHQFASFVPILMNCQATAVIGHELLWKRQKEDAKAVAVTKLIPWINWAGLVAEAIELNAERIHGSQGGIAFLQYTSGSTGNPKGVIVDHANILHNLEQIIERCETTVPRKILSWLPHFHDMGLIAGILKTVYTGSELFVMAPGEFMRRPASVLEMIHRYRVSFSFCPESALYLVQQAVNRDHLKTLDLSCLDCLVCGSEPIRRSVLDDFLKTLEPCGLKQDVIVNAYGLAEGTLMSTSGRYTSNHAMKHGTPQDRATLASSGCSINQQTIRIVDPSTMAQVPQGVEGLIMIKGRSISRGYWNNQKNNSDCFNQSLINEQGQEENRFLNTGDLGVLVDGQLTVTGRVKDLIICGGRNIHPSDVEIIVRSLSPRHATCRCICFGLSKQDSGEKLVILIESKRKRLDPEEIIQPKYIASQISNAFRVQIAAVLVLEPNTLPITTSGKVCRREAKKRYCNSSIIPLTSWPQVPNQGLSVNSILAMIKRELGTLTRQDPLLIEASHRLEDYGLDSLRLAELKITLDQQLQTDLPFEPFLAGLTLRQMAEQMHELAAAPGLDQTETIPDDSPRLRHMMISGLPDHLLELQHASGDWISLRWGRQVIHLLSDPTEVQQLMQRPTTDFIRGKVFEGVRMVTDDSNLFTTEGQAWRSERQRVQPLLTRQAVEAMAGDFASISKGCLLESKGTNNSATLDLADLCRKITLKITIHKLFGPISVPMAERLLKALSAETDWRLPLHYLAQAELREAADKTQGSAASFNDLLPELDEMVYWAIDEQLETTSAPDCLLTSYLANPEVQAMANIDRRRYLRSVMLSLVLAGLDTTGSGLFFSLDLLGRHITCQEQVRDEINKIFGNGEIIPTNLPEQLPYTLAVVQEALRLFPPVWFLGREAVSATTVMKQHVAAGDIVLTSPYVIHRHREHWSEPESFQPERFMKRSTARQRKPLFMPFGIGARRCVGNWLALYEICLSVAALVQKQGLITSGVEKPELSSYFTLKTLEPISLRVEPLQ